MNDFSEAMKDLEESIEMSREDESGEYIATTNGYTNGHADGLNGHNGDNQAAAGRSETPPRPTSSRLARKSMMDVDDLFGGTEPPSSPKPSAPVSGPLLEETKLMYIYEYAKGIDLFLETDWYSHQGLQHLLQDTKLFYTFTGLLELLRNTIGTDYEAVQKIPPVEAKVIWKLMCMPRAVAENARNEQVNPFQDPKLEEVLHRLNVVEYLICNRPLPIDTFSTLRQSYESAMTAEDRQYRFWRLLAQFVSSPTSARPDVDFYLSEIRKILDMMENRDVLYSMAVVRHVGLAPPILPMNLAEAGRNQRERNKLTVAKKFIEDEAAAKGTTQIVQRICGMVVRSWAVMGLPFWDEEYIPSPDTHIFNGNGFNGS